MIPVYKIALMPGAVIEQVDIPAKMNYVAGLVELVSKMITNVVRVCSLFFCAVATVLAATAPVFITHPIYAGATGGYGSTTWEGLVPTPVNQNMAMKTSTPVMVREGGIVWGVFAGYEFSPSFALEANYMRYPKAAISFDELSMFAFDNDGLLQLYTDTETISIMAKVMLMIPRTTMRVYSSFGAAEIHRWDDMNENKRYSPTFGVGFNYPLSEHVLSEVGINYTAGYGESELNPARDYVPFLYSACVKLAYRF